MLPTHIEAWKQAKKVEWMQEGERIGELKGELRGRLEGKLEGKLEGETKILTRLLQRRFGELPAWASEKMAKADLATIEAWSLRILEAPTLESVLTDPL